MAQDSQVPSFEEELRKAQDRNNKKSADQNQRLSPNAPPETEKVPALQQKAIEPSWVGKSGTERTTQDRLRLIQFQEQQQAALERGDPLPQPGDVPTANTKGVWSDVKTTTKIGLMYPVVGSLKRGEENLQLRQLTKNKVWENIPDDDKAAILKYSGKKSIEDMRWQDLERAAEKHYGVQPGEGDTPSRSIWRENLRAMQGYTGDETRMRVRGFRGAAQEVNAKPEGAPAFPMADELITGSIETGSDLNFYESFVRKKFSEDTPRLANEAVLAIQEAAKDYQQSTKESIDKTMVAEDAVWFNPLTYFDETTKDPYHDLTGFLHTMGQQMGNMGAAIIAGRVGGRIGAGRGGASVGIRATREAIQRAQQVGGRIGGGVGGGGTEMVLIRDGVFAEAVEGVKNLPDEIWDNHQPYLDLVEGGLSSEEAKQIISYQHANNAGDTAMMLSGVLLGTPMGMFYGGMSGRSAGRQLAKEGVLKQMGKGAALETGQEMSQEFVEQVSSNLAKARVNPDQDIYEGGLEAVTTAFFISAVPGAVGGIRGDKGAGITAERDQLIRKTQPWVNAMNQRWKHQNKVGPNTSFAKDASPQQQLKAMLELERLQKKEAEEFNKVKGDARSLMEKTGVTPEQMLEFESQVAGYEMLEANIAKQQTRRAESKKALREEQRIASERLDAQKSVQRDVKNLSEANTLVDQLDAIQKGEPLEQSGYEELAKAGYGKYSGKSGEIFVLTPRGVRAIPELNAMINQTRKKISSGYAGPERRADPERREAIEGMTQEEFENQIYVDADTNLRNKRAWNEESGQHKAVAVLDADSLKWVNDNMSHSAGTEYLKKIASEIEEIGGSTVSYRYGGDEFIVGAQSMDELQDAVEAAVSRINQATRVEEGGQSVKPSVTVGFGADFDEADAAMSSEKISKTDRGERAGRYEAPPSFRTVADKAAPQMSLFHYQDDLFNMNTEALNEDGYWEEYTRVTNIREKAQALHVRPVTEKQMNWIEEVAESFLPKANANNPNVTIVHDPAELHEVSPRQYDELLEIGFNVWGVRGLFSLDDPTHGVFLIASNIVSQAEKGLRRGQRITSWKSARTTTSVGHQVEVIDRNGTVLRGLVSHIKTDKPAVYAGKNMETRRAEKQLEKRERELAQWKRHVDKLDIKAAKLTDEEYNNFDNPLVIKFDDAVEKEYRLISQVQALRAQLIDERNKRYTSWKPVDTTDDRIKVMMPDGTELEFDPNTNEQIFQGKGDRARAKANLKRWLSGQTTPHPSNRFAVRQGLVQAAAGFNSLSSWKTRSDVIHDKLIQAANEGTYGEVLASFMKTYNVSEEQLINEMVSTEVEEGRRKRAPKTITGPLRLGRIRGKGYKQKGWSTYWHDNLGNEEASVGEELTKGHLRELVADTLMHETIGHYGIRGVTRDYKSYERLTHDIVDAFPDEVAALRRMGYKYRDDLSASQNKGLLGEEVLAWRIGHVYGQMKEMTPVQQSAIKRFMTWLKEILLRMGYGKIYYGAKRLRVRRVEDQLNRLKKPTYNKRDHALIKKIEARLKTIKSKGFLSDDDLTTVVARIHDYIRNGGQKWKFRGADGNLHVMPMRDSEIFLPPVSHAVNATRPLDEGEVMPTQEAYGAAPEPISMSEAYIRVTGRQMPDGWNPLTPASFKDAAKALEAEMIVGKTPEEIKQMKKNRLFKNPKQLYDEATAAMSEDEKALGGKVQKIIAASKKEAEDASEKARKLNYQKELNRRLRNQFGDDAVNQGKIPLFPETATIQGYLEATSEALSRGYLTKAEIEASGIYKKLWPSKIDKLWSMSSLTDEVISEFSYTQYGPDNKTKGIPLERFIELKKPFTQMTAEEAQVMADLVVAHHPLLEGQTESGRIFPLAPKEWAFVEEWEHNNALTLTDVGGSSVFTMSETDWVINMLGPTHEISQSWATVSELANKEGATHEQKSAALKAMDAIGNVSLPPTAVNLPKAWLLETLETPAYEIIVGDPKPPRRSRRIIYKAITGEDMPGDYDQHLERNNEMEEKIDAEIMKDIQLGPDIGYDPRTGTWNDPQSDYSGERGTWENLRVPGIISGTYKAAVFFQVPSGNAKASSSHFPFANIHGGKGQGSRGNVGHTRYGMVYDADENPPTADNPDNQGMAAAFYESQADNAQRLNKRYPSGAEEQLANELHSTDVSALTESYSHMVEGVADVFLDSIFEKMDKVLSSTEQQMQYLSTIREHTEITAMSDEDKQMLLEKKRLNDSSNLVDLIGRAITVVKNKYEENYNLLPTMVDPNTSSGSQAGPFAADARAFQILDDVAKYKMLSQMQSMVANGLSDELNELTRAANDQTMNAIKAVGGVRAVLRRSVSTPNVAGLGNYLNSSLLTVVNNGTGEEKKEYGFRFNSIPDQTKTLLTEIVDQMKTDALLNESNNSEEIVGKIMESMKDIGSATVTFDTTAMANILGVSEGDIKNRLEDFEDYMVNIGDGGVSIDIDWNPVPNAEYFRYILTGKVSSLKNFETQFRDHLQKFMTKERVERQESDARREIRNLETNIEQLVERSKMVRRSVVRVEHKMDYVQIGAGLGAELSTIQLKTKGWENNESIVEEEALAVLAAHEVMTFREYVAAAWARGYPRMDNQEEYNEETPPEWKIREYREKYNGSKPYVVTGAIPIAWDEDGEPTETVPMNIVRKKPGGHIILRVDGTQMHVFPDTYYSDVHYGRQITKYYESKNIVPPSSSKFGGGSDLVVLKANLLSQQRTLDTVTKETESLVESSMTDVPPTFDTPPKMYGNLAQAFDNEIAWHKRSGVQAQNLIERNEQWRINHIQHQFSDMVRRGIPRLFFYPGTSSGARGGFISGVDTRGLEQAKYETVITDKIKWSLHRKELRGEQRDIIIVESEDINTPLWIDVTADKLVTFNPKRKVSDDPTDLTGYFSAEITAQLGRYVAENIAMKIRNSKVSGSKVDDGDKLLISRTPNNMWVVHNRAGVVIGTAINEEQARNIRNNYQNQPAAEEVTQDSALSVSGIVSEGELGVPIHILKTRYHGGGIRFQMSHEYQHTISRSTMEGGRRNYDITFMKNMREYAAKFDMKIEEGTQKVPSSEIEIAVRAQGLPRIVRLREDIAEQYNNITIEEVTGENYGWIVNSDDGVVLPNVFPSEQSAGEALRGWIDQNVVPDTGIVKTYQVTLNDKAKEAHKKGVSPFIAVAYEMNDDLKAAHEKIGSKEPRLIDRFNAWRQSWRANFNIGVFDRLYGIKHAIENQGIDGLDAAEDPYVQARMTTGLESMMRGIMEYGHPVRREGIIENEGKGLLEILEPIAGDVEMWAMYMAGVRAKRLAGEGREKLFTDDQVAAMVNLGEEFPIFKEVAAEYAKFNKHMLDFAESSGVINPETRPLWENADYIPFYRIADDRLVGPLAKGVGIANQHSPIKTLKGGEANLGDLVHNIFTNMTNLMDSSVKNHAALLSIDLLQESGVIRKQPHAMTKELIPMSQVGKILQQHGMDIKSMPAEVAQGLQTMFAVQPPEGPGIISVLRDGKKEFYFTEDELLYRSLAAINIKAFGAWMNLLRTPKRLLTTWITLDPGFMLSNFVRDSMSAFVLSRDKFIPLAAGLKGFGQAIVEGDTMRTMVGAGAAFESGYINQGDPNAARKQVKRAMKDAGFQRTVLDTPRKLFNAWKRVGSASENANRIAVYEAARRSGKSKAQAAFESKDLMDFSMGGDWPFIQFLIQTVPFMGARMQGIQRLGRGAAENPLAFATKGLLLTMAGMSLWFAFRDDDRYKELEEWDKDTYFHWWLGDNHYRLPKGFEVGAIFNTIPERIFEYMYSNENDAGKLLLQRFGFMIAETFNMNPTPQTFRPMVESWMNKNFFRGSQIETPYEEDRLPPERYRYYTSPTMVELARILPEELDLVSQKIRSPLHLQNLYAGYTGTLGRYVVMASDALIRHTMDYPEKPDMAVGNMPVLGRFYRGDSPRRTKYEEEFYNMLRTTIQVKESLRFLDKQELDARFDMIEKEYAPYVDSAQELESYRKEVSALNREVREINEDKKMSGADKRRQINEVQKEKNAIFKEAWELRPGARDEGTKISRESIDFLMKNFNVDATDANEELRKKAPITSGLLNGVSTMPTNQLERLAGTSSGEQ